MGLAAKRVPRYKPCRVAGCTGRGIYEICGGHSARAVGRGLDPKRLTSEQFAALAILIPKPLPPRGPCRVPGCNASGIRNLCKLHTYRARGRRLDLRSLTAEQLAGLATCFREPVPHGPCRVPGCNRISPKNLCVPHRALARRRGLDPAALTAKQLAALAQPDRTPPPCRVPGCMYFGPSGLCQMHQARARAKGFNAPSLTRKQLESLVRWW